MQIRKNHTNAEVLKWMGIVKSTINYKLTEVGIPNPVSEAEGLLVPKMSVYFSALL